MKPAAVVVMRSVEPLWKDGELVVNVNGDAVYALEQAECHVDADNALGALGHAFVAVECARERKFRGRPEAGDVVSNPMGVVRELDVPALCRIAGRRAARLARFVRVRNHARPLRLAIAR